MSLRTWTLGTISLAAALTACGGGEALRPLPHDPEPVPHEARGPEPLVVMSFNVLCSFCNLTDYDPWAERLEYFRDIFDRHDPDLLGVQELIPLGDEPGELLALLPGREAVYYAPEEGLPYPDATIFYRASRFELLDHGQYWLSPTPDKPSTGFAPPQLTRLVVWARLRDRAGDRELFFATTHFDNNSPSQELSAPLVKERSAPFVKELPVLFVGDFNSNPSTAAWKILTEDASQGFVFTDTHAIARERSVISNQSVVPEYDTSQRIDHIFAAGAETAWSASRWAADLTVYGAKDGYPSDHFPVVTELDYQ